MINTLLIILGIIVFIFLISIRQVSQYQRGVKFTLGKYSGTINPGWRLVFPIFQSYRKVDLRVKAVDVQKQEAITKDNISVGVNAVIYYKVVQAEKAILEVENFYYAISQMAQTTLRSVVGQMTLDDLLTEREKINNQLQDIIDKATDPWGIKVSNVEVKHVDLPQEMQRAMARQAEAERERRAKIIAAEGEYQAAEKLTAAAKTIATEPMALQMRYLQTLVEISTEKSSTIVFPLPLEIMKTFLDKKK